MKTQRNNKFGSHLLSTIVGLIATLLMLTPQCVIARTYNFVKLAESFDINNGAPAISANGLNTVWSQCLNDPPCATQVIRSRKKEGEPTDIANTEDGIFSIFGYPTINNSGIVTFSSLDPVTVTANGIHIGSGGPITTIADTTTEITTIGGIKSTFSSFNWDPVINNPGRVAFDAGLQIGGSGVYVGDKKGNIQTIAETDETFDNLLGFVAWDGDVAPAFNDSGTVAFLAILKEALPLDAPERSIICGGDPACLPGQVRSLFVTSPKGLIKIVDNTGRYLSFTGAPAITGSAAVFYIFRADGTNADGSPYRGVNLYQRGKTATLVDNAGGFFRFGYVATNDAAQIAFNAITDQGVGGIYTGPDLVANKVIDFTDELDGKSIIDDPFGAFLFYHQGLSNRGQITFGVRFEDGTQAIYRADPRP